MTQKELRNRFSNLLQLQQKSHLLKKTKNNKKLTTNFKNLQLITVQRQITASRMLLLNSVLIPKIKV